MVASPREVVWSRTLGDGLRLLLAAEQGGARRRHRARVSRPVRVQTRRRPRPSRRPGPRPGCDALSGDVEALIEYANLHYELAQAALRDGDLATYGEEIEPVGAALQELDALGASPAP